VDVGNGDLVWRVVGCLEVAAYLILTATATLAFQKILAE
jgi:hypothetical protein